MKIQLLTLVPLFLALAACERPAAETDASPAAGETAATRLPVIFDTDANNELDDQHALAYLVFNADVFDVRGVTVNATHNGGGIDEHYAEAKRVLELCALEGEVPLLAGADGDFESIAPQLEDEAFDGAEAVNFIIEEARKERDTPLIVLAVGKLTNVALAVEKAPDIVDDIRLVWLGSNYPAPGEYNLVNDIPSMNYLLESSVPFEMVTVRYGEPSGTDAVRITPDEAREKLAGLGPQLDEPVTGRHGGTFDCFGDYAVNLFENIKLYGDPPSRALFDMAAVAIVKNPDWAESRPLPAPIMKDEAWVDRPDNPREIILWEHFDTEAILADFFESLRHPQLEAE